MQARPPKRENFKNQHKKHLVKCLNCYIPVLEEDFHSCKSPRQLLLAALKS
jgi:hypothetical protein